MNPRGYLFAVLSWLTRLWDRCFPTKHPSIVYVDEDGVGWREKPDWMEAHAPDKGQHDNYKRDLRVHVYRALRTESGEPRGFGLAEAQHLGFRHPFMAPRLWPMGSQLAEACRRLGFGRMVRAAASDLLDADGVDPNAIHVLHLEVLAHAEKEAQRMSSAPNGDPIEFARKLFDVGPVDGHADQPPLNFVQLDVVDGKATARPSHAEYFRSTRPQKKSWWRLW